MYIYIRKCECTFFRTNINCKNNMVGEKLRFFFHFVQLGALIIVVREQKKMSVPLVGSRMAWLHVEGLCVLYNNKANMFMQHTMEVMTQSVKFHSQTLIQQGRGKGQQRKKNGCK